MRRPSSTLRHLWSMAERSRTVSFHTLGCKLNTYDTQWFREQFVRQGYRVVTYGEPADVTVVNTCTVTGQGDAQSRQMLRKAHRISPGGTVVAVGCYAQTDGDRLIEMPEVDLVVGTAERDRLLDLLGDGCSLGQAFVTRGRAARFQDMDIEEFGGRARAFVKVQEGCDAFCSFCVIPFARGRSRSRGLVSTLDQVKRLVDSGYQEVVLTGVNVGEYGRDLEAADLCGSVDLLGLLEAVDGIPGLRRFRVSSIEVSHLSDDVIDLLAGSRRFCRHLHVPLQSGDDGILGAMRRPYTCSEYLKRLERLVERVPGIGIGGDVMVGFPGEAEEAYRRTVETITESPLAYLHVFPFSVREGTPAARMENQVSPSTKKRRAAELRDLGSAKKRAFIAGFLGEALEVLFEGRREPETGHLQGVTDNYIRVFAPGPDCAMDRIRTVRLERLDGERVIGEIGRDESCERKGDAGRPELGEMSQHKLHS